MMGCSTETDKHCKRLDLRTGRLLYRLAVIADFTLDL